MGYENLDNEGIGQYLQDLKLPQKFKGKTYFFCWPKGSNSNPQQQDKWNLNTEEFQEFFLYPKVDTEFSSKSNFLVF